MANRVYLFGIGSPAWQAETGHSVNAAGVPIPVRPRRRSAELVLVESPMGGSWTGRFINWPAVVDRLDSSNVGRAGGLRFVARIVDQTEELERRRDLRPDRLASVGVASPGFPFEVTTQGAHPGSRRYSSWPTLAAAQAYLIRWAARRFAYSSEVR